MMRADMISASTGVLRKNTTYMLSAHAARLVIQGIYFLLMTRSLGPQQYGAFAAVIATVSIASPFVGNGTANLMVKHVARDRRLLPECLGNALFMTLTSGLLLSVLAAPLCLAVLRRTIPVSAILLVVLSDLIAYRITDVVGLAFQSVERLGWTAHLNVFATLMRLGGIVVVVLIGRPTLLAWSVAYAVASVICTLVAIACAALKLDRPVFSGLGNIRAQLREGLWFATSLSAQTIYNDVDKTMLARLATLDAAGIYAAAYRFIEFAFLPVRAFLAAAYPSFFRHGEVGVAASLQFARRLSSKPLVYAAGVGGGMMLAAPLIPHMLGAEYARASEALRWLSLLPLLKTLHYFAADALTGAGCQALRTLLQVMVAGFNAMINLWLIPAYSWRGAAWSSLASDGLLAVALWSGALLVRNRSFGKLVANPQTSHLQVEC